MKRTCNNCKALDKTGDFYCRLGYKIERKVWEGSITISCKPKEECEKPLTISDFIEIYNKKKSRKEN